MSDVLKQLYRLGLMDPTDQEILQRRTLAPRLAEVRGTVGGFLDNCTQNASVLLDHIAKRLSAEDGMAEAVHRAKFIYWRVAEPPIIDELAERCDFVVAAIGDRGSCVSCSMQDVLAFEDRGIPTVLLYTEPFMNSASDHAEAFGNPDYQVVHGQTYPRLTDARAD
jgi:hypothetical protein